MKVTDLTTLGIASSVGAIFFVPPGFPAAGSMKIASYNASRWYSVEFEEDGTGAYNLTSATQNLQFSGGPEGITYVPQGSKSFPRDSILMALYGRGAVITAPLDADGNPRLDEAQDVITGLTGAEGAVIDPKTGDFLFSTFGGGKSLVRVTGFKSLGGVAEAYRPNMVRSVPSPADISTEPDVVGTNLTLALITMLCIFVAAQLFNATISENKDEIEEMLAPVTKPLRSISARLPRRSAPVAPAAGWMGAVKWPAIVLALSVLIYGFTDPGFGVNGNSAVLALSLLITIGLVTYVTEGGEAYLGRTRFGQETDVRPFPVAIVIAIVNVAICRAVGFGPGVIYGFVGTTVFLRPSTLTRSSRRATVFLPAVAMLGVSVAVGCWWCRYGDRREHRCRGAGVLRGRGRDALRRRLAGCIPEHDPGVVHGRAEDLAMAEGRLGGADDRHGVALLARPDQRRPVVPPGAVVDRIGGGLRHPHGVGRADGWRVAVLPQAEVEDGDRRILIGR